MKLIEHICRLLSQDKSFEVDMIDGELTVQREYIQYSPTGDPNDLTEEESPTYRIAECEESGIHIFDQDGEEIYCDFLKSEGFDIWFDYDNLQHFLKQRLPIVDVRKLHYEQRQERMLDAAELETFA